MSDINPSQIMRVYFFNKYTHNDLKLINRKNTDNINMKSMNINMINIKKNHFDEDYKSDISSDSKDEPILYTKKLITNKNNIKTRTTSVDNEIERNLNNINLAGEAFTTFFFNPTSDNKPKHSNNINKINKHFNSSNALFNNYRGIEPKKNLRQ